MNKTISYKNKIIFTTLALLSIIYIPVILIYAYWREYNVDELEAFHTAWKIFQGEQIYVDFFQHHHPLTYYLLVPIAKLCGPNTCCLIHSRMVSLALLAILIIFLYKTTKLVCNKITAWIAILFLLSNTAFICSAVEIRPDVGQLTMAIVSFYFLLSYFSTKKLSHLILSSFFMSISFLFLQKAYPFMLLTGIVCLYQWIKKEIPFKAIILYPLIFLIPFACYLAYLYYAGSISHYFTYNWFFNFGFCAASTPFTASMHKTMFYFIPRNPFFWSFFLLGIFFVPKNNYQKIVTFFAIGLFLFLFTFKHHASQYFMQVIPMTSIITAYGIYSLIHTKKYLFAILLILTISPGSIVYLRGAYLTSKTAQIKRISYLLSITNATDYVLYGGNKINLFRKTADFYWFTISSKPEAVEKLIQEKNPKIIYNCNKLATSTLEKINNASFGIYKPDKNYPDLLVKQN